MADYEFAEFNSDESEPEYDQLDVQQRHYNFRPPVIYDNPTQFRERFRFTPRQADILLNQLGEKLDSIVAKNHALSSKEKLLIALRFFASNDFYYSVGDAQGPSKTTVMDVIKKTTRAIIEVFFDTIKWPESEFECRRIASRFSRLSKPHGMPNVCGCADGTLVDIVAPANTGGVFVGRHRRTCLNVLGISDGGGKFLFLSSKFPGAVHDQRVLRKTIGVKFDQGWRPFRDAFLLGDSGYLAKDWIIPMKEGWNTQIEKYFYGAHAKTRSDIERLFGIWKNRFICLKGASGRGPLRFRNPTVSASVVMACGYLQNFLIDNRLEEENDDHEFEEELEILPAVEQEFEGNEGNEGNARLNFQMTKFQTFNNL